MKGYLLPYTFRSATLGVFPHGTYERHVWNSKGCFTVWKDMDSYWHGVGLFTSTFKTKEEAMNALDRHLIEDGWYLISEDELERFTEKLSLLL